MSRAPGREFHGNKILLGIHVVFAGLVDDSNLMMFYTYLIRENLINPAQLQGSGIAPVANANGELWFRFHVRQGRASTPKS